MRPGLPQRSCIITVLDFRARVSGCPAILAELQRLFPQRQLGSLSTPAVGGERPVASVFDVQSISLPRPRYRILQDGASLWSTSEREEVVPILEWGISSAAVRHVADSALLFHAGALAYAGRGLLLPARSGSGKTTLTAALLGVGFQYLSDEVAVLPLATGCVYPFNRAMCIKDGSRPALGPLYPELCSAPPRHRFGTSAVWYVRPPEASWAAQQVPVRHVVFPRYVAGAATALTPLARSAALPLLLQQSFSARQLGRRGIEATVALLQGADCFTLTAGDLPTAVDALRQLVGAATPLRTRQDGSTTS